MPGFYSEAAGATRCTACAPGRVSDPPQNATRCKDCEMHEYIDNNQCAGAPKIVWRTLSLFSERSRFVCRLCAAHTDCDEQNGCMRHREPGECVGAPEEGSLALPATCPSEDLSRRTRQCDEPETGFFLHNKIACSCSEQPGCRPGHSKMSCIDRIATDTVQYKGCDRARQDYYLEGDRAWECAGVLNAVSISCTDEMTTYVEQDGCADGYYRQPGEGSRDSDRCLGAYKSHHFRQAISPCPIRLPDAMLILVACVCDHSLSAAERVCEYLTGELRCSTGTPASHLLR